MLVRIDHLRVAAALGHFDGYDFPRETPALLRRFRALLRPEGQRVLVGT